MGLLAGHARITPFLWFDGCAQEAAEFYVGVFRNSRITGGAAPEGQKAMVVTFVLDGQPMMALNGGPQFPFTEAVSFMVRCETEEELDYYWGRLVEGGKESQCGWLKDRFGLSWQVVPERLGEWLRRPKAMQAMMGMKKLDWKTLEAAAAE